MNPNRNQLEVRCDVVIESLLTLLLAFAPLAFGATEAWSEEIVLLLSAGMVLTLLVKLLLRPKVTVLWSWSYLPIGLFVVLVLFQLLPLSQALLERISSNTVRIRAELLADLPSPNAGGSALTLYRTATWHDLRLLLAVAGVFIVVANVYRTPRQVMRLLKTIAAIGAGVALIAAYQNLAGSERIYGVVPSGHPNSGPFLNHSHFGQFMNLSIGGLLALLLVTLNQLDGPDGRFGMRWRNSSAMAWWLGAAIVLCATTAFLSLTRGGTISLLIAGAATVLAIGWRRAGRGHAAVMVVLGMTSFAALLYFGFDAVYDRMATLRHVATDNGNRWQILQDVLVISQKFPVLGTGLGTHEFVFPMFDRSTTAGRSTHAENEYAQILEETGLLGLVLCILFVVFICVQYFRCISRERQTIHLAAFGLGFGLLAVLCHSLSDFGQHLPANAVLTAVSAGLLVGIARFGGFIKVSVAPVSTTNRWGFATRAAVLTVTATVACACICTADRARRAEDSFNNALELEARLDEQGWENAEDRQFAALINQAARAVELAPEDVAYRLWLNAYRWRAISQRAERIDNDKNLELAPESMEFTARIVSELHEARSHCPTYGPLYAFVGQLEHFVLDRREGAAHIRTGYRLAAYDAEVCRVKAILDAQDGRWDDSLIAARRAVKLDAALWQDVSGIYLDAGRIDLAKAAAAGDASALSRLSEQLQPIDAEIASRCRHEALALLRVAANRPGVSAATLAHLADLSARDGSDADAIVWYRKALDLDYGQVAWRFQLARLFAKVGNADSAFHEAQICLRLRPQMREADALIAILSERRITNQ